MTSQPTPTEWRRVTIVAATFLLLFVLACAGVTLLQDILPGIRPGSTQVVEAKIQYLAEHAVFSADVRNRVVILGDSQTLSGFNPQVFDANRATQVASFNMGLPGIPGFVDSLEAYLDATPVKPTHVLLTKPWLPSPPTWYQRLTDDDWIVKQIFPFRFMFRNAVVFLGRSLRHGGPVAFYRKSIAEVDNVITARGYHFITSQSYYEGDRIPDDFALASDTPDQPFVRDFPMESTRLKKLLQLRDSHGFQLIYVPRYCRKNQNAKSEPDLESRRAVEKLGIRFAGPDYWQLENRCFSDSVHLNPAGAEEFTRRLRALLDDTGFLDSP